MAVLSSSEARPSTVAAFPALGGVSVSPAGLLATASAVALGASATLDPATVGGGPVMCPFRLATGLPCPGCGMTRAWVFLAHGHLADAAQANPFALLVMPAAVLLVLAVLAAFVRRRPPPDLTRLARSSAARVVAVAWLVFAAGRIIAVLTGHASP